MIQPYNSKYDLFCKAIFGAAIWMLFICSGSSISAQPTYPTISDGKDYRTIIGDTDLVATFEPNKVAYQIDSYCNGGTPTYLQFWGPVNFDDSGIFYWAFDHYNEPGFTTTVSVYFFPNNLDTITRCGLLEVHFPNPPRGCSSLEGVFNMCYTGCGISPDSLILIRPKVQSATLNPIITQKKYSRTIWMLLSNYTDAPVTITSAQLVVDSTSHITMDPLQDSLGNVLTTIPPWAKKMRIQFQLSSDRGPNIKDEIYSSSLHIRCSRLGIDSEYVNTLSILLPRPATLGLQKLTDSIVVNNTVGEIRKDTIRFLVTDSILNFRVDSLPYPFKVTSVDKVSNQYIVEVTIGPALSGKYAATATVHYDYIAFDGSILSDVLSVPLKTTSDLLAAAPDTIRFIGDGNTDLRQTLSFVIPSFAAFDSVDVVNPTYPFFIRSVATNTDSCFITVGCNGTGGDYFGKLMISYPVKYFGDSKIQHFTTTITAELSPSTDSNIWVKTNFDDTVRNIQCDSNGGVYVVSGSMYLSKNGGDSWIKNSVTPGLVNELIVDTTGLYFLSTDKTLWKSTDKGIFWNTLDGMKHSDAYNPPECMGATYTSPLTHIFRGYPFDDQLYGFVDKISPYCSPFSVLYKSSNNGNTWTGYPNANSAWGKDATGSFYPQPIYNTESIGLVNSRPAIRLSASEIILPTNSHGIYFTNDSGKNWHGIIGGLPTKEVTCAAFDGERIWIGTTKGVYKSKNIHVKQSNVVFPASELSTLYPNPATNIINLPKGSGNPFELSIYDISGRMLQQFPYYNQHILSVGHLANGIYQIVLKTDMGSSRYRVVISR